MHTQLLESNWEAAENLDITQHNISAVVFNFEVLFYLNWKDFELDCFNRAN